jgi:hypothetical protein
MEDWTKHASTLFSSMASNTSSIRKDWAFEIEYQGIGIK